MASEFEETRSLDTSDVPRLTAGSTLGRRYRLEAELGRGGMGIVFRATDLELRRDVAVKVLPEAATSPAARERLLREARAAAALNHPAIVAVHDVGEHHGIPFFVMELVTGTDLHHARPDDPAAIVRIASRICDALEHAHAHGIVHRDLKPENVLLSGPVDRRSVKLADLGVAFRADGGKRATDSGAIVGTVSYMAPEQAMGEAVDGRADLYALGVMLYEMFTGRLPFVGKRPLEIVSQHVHAPVVPPRTVVPSLSHALEAVVMKLLAKQPAQRYATAAEVRAALERALNEPDAAPASETVGSIALLEALARGKMVGRADELAEARELWDRAREGSGHALLISGEPGAGKTRLAKELMIQAALDGGQVFTGACYEYETAMPYLPLAEAFRRFVRDETNDERLRASLGDAASRLAKLAPDIATRLGPFPERPVLAAHEEKLLFVDAVADVLRTAARARGVLFYVDDLHWADASTLSLMSRLLRALRNERVLFAASYREMELDRAHPLSAALVDWNRERLSTRIALKRFNAAQTREQLMALMCENVSTAFADTIYRETEGNPFFVEEVLKALIDRGSVRRDRTGWTRVDLEDLAIPQSVKAAIGHRLDKVPAETSDVLRAAAVLGKTFGFQDLLAVAGERGEDKLLDALDAAVAAQLLVTGRDDSFSFTHDKIREVLYDELNPIRRRRLHKRTAEGLEKARADCAVCAEKLAHHFIEAGEHERGLFWARQAGDEAAKLFAYDEAIAAYARAIECARVLGRTDDELELEELSGKTLLISGNLIVSREHFERALALTQDPAVRVRLQVSAAASLVVVGDPRGLDYVRGALQVLDPKTQSVEYANALVTEARFHHLAGQHRRAAEALEKAAVLVQPPAGSQTLSPAHASVLTQIYAYSAGAYQHLCLYETADLWAHRAIAFGERYNVPYAQAAGWEFIGENAWGKAEWEAALDAAVKEREIATRLHSRERFAWIYMYTGAAYLGTGNFQQSLDDLQAGIALAQAIGESRLLLLLHPYLAVAQAKAGDLELGARTAEAAMERAEEARLLYMRTEARRSLGVIRVMQGRLTDGVALFESVLELTEGTDAKVSRMWTGPSHVEALLALGRKDDARRCLDAYAADVAQCQAPYFDAEVARLRATAER